MRPVQNANKPIPEEASTYTAAVDRRPWEIRKYVSIEKVENVVLVKTTNLNDQLEVKEEKVEKVESIK